MNECTLPKHSPIIEEWQYLSFQSIWRGSGMFMILDILAMVRSYYASLWHSKERTLNNSTASWTNFCWYSKSNSFMVSLHFGWDFFLMPIFVQLHKHQECTPKSKKIHVFLFLSPLKKTSPSNYTVSSCDFRSCTRTDLWQNCMRVQETPERSIRVASPWRWWPIKLFPSTEEPQLKNFCCCYILSSVGII